MQPCLFVHGFRLCWPFVLYYLVVSSLLFTPPRGSFSSAFGVPCFLPLLQLFSLLGGSGFAWVTLKRAVGWSLGCTCKAKLKAARMWFLHCLCAWFSEVLLRCAVFFLHSVFSIVCCLMWFWCELVCACFHSQGFPDSCWKSEKQLLRLCRMTLSKQVWLTHGLCRLVQK